jgi:hypothetical protein
VAQVSPLAASQPQYHGYTLDATMVSHTCTCYLGDCLTPGVRPLIHEALKNNQQVSSGTHAIAATVKAAADPLVSWDAKRYVIRGFPSRAADCRLGLMPSDDAAFKVKPRTQLRHGERHRSPGLALKLRLAAQTVDRGPAVLRLMLVKRGFRSAVHLLRGASTHIAAATCPPLSDHILHSTSTNAIRHKCRRLPLLHDTVI